MSSSPAPQSVVLHDPTPDKIQLAVIMTLMDRFLGIGVGEYILEKWTPETASLEELKGRCINLLRGVTGLDLLSGMNETRGEEPT